MRLIKGKSYKIEIVNRSCFLSWLISKHVNSSLQLYLLKFYQNSFIIDFLIKSPENF